MPLPPGLAEAVRRYAARSTAASAALEGRVVPPGFERSAGATRFLAARRLASMEPHPPTDPTSASPLVDASLEPDDLDEVAREIDPKLLARAHRMRDDYVARIRAAERGLWAPTLPEPPDGTRLEFEVDTDLYAVCRDDTASAHAGYPFGDDGVTWHEYNRSMPRSWAILCAEFGQEALAGAVRLLVHPEDAHKRLAWRSAGFVREVLAAEAAREAEELARREV